MPPDEPNEEEGLEELPENGETHPSTDAAQQPEELYDTGLNIQEPNAGNAVKGYDPTKDQRLRK